MSHGIDLLGLFAPASSAHHAGIPLPASSLALVGPIPSSSLLHLALSHLRHEDEEDTASPLFRSPRAQGKQRARDQGGDGLEPESEGEDSEDKEDDGAGPRHDLPTRPTRRVLILTPDEAALQEELAKECDVSLFGLHQDGHTAKLLDRIDLRYVPSSAHLRYLLSTLYTFQSVHAAEAQAAYLQSSAKSVLDPSCLESEPTLVILQSPSDYLDEPTSEGSGIEAYAAIIAHFMSTFRRLTTSPPLLVIIDPFASAITLPVLPAGLSSSRPAKRRFPGNDEPNAPEKTAPDGIKLKHVLERFFDYVGEVEKIPPSSPPPDHTVEQQPARFLLSCSAMPRLRNSLDKSQHQLGFEYVVHRIDENDAEGEEPGGMRIEVIGL